MNVSTDPVRMDLVEFKKARGLVALPGISREPAQL
jgi:hypothetical protein